ncbi:Lem3/Cdc50 [Pleomassaria siparia CBS 279.74]|uniref:Lem3/Cdc50 n=1 Tax=Pleomassaria siparia CBS 279.74 TaxID=1314801 RepID=A0A6G1KEG1_9PLEO|nr:Lem3/Cdc50 [Pleomassaria siparia CBS 279.74]
MSQTQQVGHTDSISSQDPHQQTSKKTKSRRPASEQPNNQRESRQQRLKAWQPILTPKTVLPLFFIVGVIFAPIGALLLYASSQVQELSIDYTDCSSAPETSVNETTVDTLTVVPTKNVNSAFKSSMKTQPKWGSATDTYTWPSGREEQVPVCILQFNIPNNIDPPILFYYRMTNFYQNHRRYVKSLDTAQLKGDARDKDQITAGDCDPLDIEPGTGKPYYPCGLIANSMFNDTFFNFTALNPQGGTNASTEYTFTKSGIAWDTEKDLYGVSKYTPDQVVPPPNWAAQYIDGEGYTKTGLPDLHTMQDFQVWMRTAGLPTFSKLGMRNDDDILKSGDYRLKIYSRFDVKQYGGTKSILISTRTVMGGKNPFLGIAYVVVGGLCILLGAIFTATHLIKPRKLGDHTYLSWNNDQPSTATATGRSSRPGDTA